MPVSERRRVVVTGLGLVTPVGCGVDTAWKNILSGNSGASKIEHFDTSDLACKVAAVIPRVDGRAGGSADMEGAFDPDKVMSARDAKRLDDFIIYDSRVAGALAYLVSIWGAEFDIPELLRFRCMDAMGNQCRNPNRNDFPRMYANPNLYLKWNLRANWILQAVSQQMGHGGLSLREIEAGLFMMGYDLPNSDDDLNAD